MQFIPILMGLTTFVAGFSTFLTHGGANKFSEKLAMLSTNVTQKLSGRAEELTRLSEALEEADGKLRDRLGQGMRDS